MVDMMLTEGTEEHQTLMEWLQRLEDLPHAVERFRRHTLQMLEEYFSKLTERTASAYASAVGAYRLSAAMAEQVMTDELSDLSGEAFRRQRENFRAEYEYRTFPLSFPICVSYQSIPHPKKVGERILAEHADFRDWETFLSLDLFRGIAAGHIPRRCQHCGRFFLLDSGYDIQYCENPAPGEPGKTCRQVGAHRKEKRLNGTDEIRKQYKTVYNRLKARKQRGTLSVAAWNDLVAEAQELKKLAEDGKIKMAELIDRYKKF